MNAGEGLISKVLKQESGEHARSGLARLAVCDGNNMEACRLRVRIADTYCLASALVRVLLEAFQTTLEPESAAMIALASNTASCEP